MKAVNIGARIKSLRKSIGLNVNEFSQRLKITLDQLLRIEAEQRTPSEDVYIGLNHEFGFSLDFIITGKNPSDPPDSPPPNPDDSPPPPKGDNSHEYFLEKLKEAVITSAVDWGIMREIIKWMEGFPFASQNMNMQTELGREAVRAIKKLDIAAHIGFKRLTEMEERILINDMENRGLMEAMAKVDWNKPSGTAAKKTAG